MSIKNRLFALLTLILAGASVVPAASADEPARRSAPSQEAAAPSQAVDINTATQAQLEALPGIGPSKALAIIQHRKSRPFARVVDLLRVRGIGRATFQQLRPMITVGLPRAAARR
jgi:competence ComEA-like helix-hairpin-helix protein